MGPNSWQEKGLLALGCSHLCMAMSDGVICLVPESRTIVWRCTAKAFSRAKLQQEGTCRNVSLGVYPSLVASEAGGE